LEGGWQLSVGFSSPACALSCADADPLNMSVAAAASINNFVIAKFSSNADCKAKPERPLGPSSPNPGALAIQLKNRALVPGTTNKIG
jgi:hypothetical protein